MHHDVAIVDTDQKAARSVREFNRSERGCHARFPGIGTIDGSRTIGRDGRQGQFSQLLLFTIHCLPFLVTWLYCSHGEEEGFRSLNRSDAVSSRTLRTLREERARRFARTTRRRADGTTRNRPPRPEGGRGRSCRLVVASSCRPWPDCGGGPPRSAAGRRHRRRRRCRRTAHERPKGEGADGRKNAAARTHARWRFVRLPAKVRRRCRFRRYRRRPFAGRPSPGARPGDLAHWQLDLAIGNTRTLATLDPCCQCETVASSNVASFQSKGPFLRVSSEALEKPDQEARRKDVRAHAPCLPAVLIS